VGERVGAGLDAEQVQEVRRARRGVEAHQPEAGLHLRAVHLGRVGLVDAAAGAEEVEHGQVRDVHPVGVAGRLEVADVARGELLAELVDEAGLADARVADDAGDLPLAPEHRGEAPIEQLELVLAADELAGAPPRPSPVRSWPASRWMTVPSTGPELATSS